MGYAFAFLVLLSNLSVFKCQEELVESDIDHASSTGNPSYSFSYGVSDVQTGDMKTVWEAKEGDTVKGHYSVLEADGSMRTVEYSANPKTGFTAVVNNDGEKVQGQKAGRSIEEKTQRDYGKFYDFSEDAELESYGSHERKRKKHPFDTVFKDFSSKKRPKYPSDLEASDFSHSITIKHPRDETGSESESHSHFGLEFDPNCKTKHKKAPDSNLYSNVVEFDLKKPQHLKYPLFSADTFKDEYEKYEPSNIDYQKFNPFGNKIPKLEAPGMDYEKYLNQYNIDSKVPKLEDFNFNSMKYKYPYIPDIPESYYPEDIPLRPKKKYKPHKNPELLYPNEEYEDYWVPKKKKKTPTRFVQSHDYRPDFEDVDHRYTSINFNDDDGDDEDERPQRGKPRRPAPTKEVVRKIVKKRKPGFNILDILDI